MSLQRGGLARSARRVGLGVIILFALVLLSFALPVRVWRTGELPAPPLALVEAGPAVHLPTRIWIDTDAACGHSHTTDPDDCFAIVLLARAPDVEIAGISTVFGNAALGVTDSTTRALAAVLGRGGRAAPPVYRGAAGPLAGAAARAPTPAVAALRRALEDGPLTLVALGPLTNVAVGLADRPDLRARIDRLVAVMGRRPGHLFHPAEGAGGGILFGHGPVFRDFNFDQDRRAAAEVLAMRLPTALVPYDVGRDVSLDEADLARLRASGEAASWVAERAKGWLEFWRDDVGRPGFYPFDLLAAGYVLDPAFFDCAAAAAWVGPDRELWTLWRRPDALLVGRAADRPAETVAAGPVLYCPRGNAGLHRRLMAGLM